MTPGRGEVYSGNRVAAVLVVLVSRKSRLLGQQSWGGLGWGGVGIRNLLPPLQIPGPYPASFGAGPGNMHFHKLPSSFSCL